MRKERVCKACGVSETKKPLSHSGLCRACGNKRMIQTADFMRQVKAEIAKRKKSE